MKFRKIGIILALSAAVLSVGCGSQKENNAETTGSTAYTEPLNGAISFTETMDWEQVKEGAQEILNPDDYPLSSYIDWAVDEETKTIRLIWPLKDEATVEDAIVYGEAIVKAFNDAAQTQDFDNIQFSTETSFGTLWNAYNLKLEVFRASDLLLEHNYYVNATFPAGSPIQIVEYVPDPNAVEEGMEGVSLEAAPPADAEQASVAETTAQ